MTNVDYINFQAFLREKIKDVSINKKAISIALGIAVARMLPLPSTAMDSVTTHYSGTLVHTANLIISEFNENIVIDVDLVSQTTRSYWMIRYTCAHPDIDMPILSMGEFGFISKINNVSKFINIDTYKFCDTNSELMVVLVNRITRLLKAKEVN